MSVPAPEVTPEQESEEQETEVEETEEETQEEDTRTEREKELETKLKKANDQAAKLRHRLKESQEGTVNPDDAVSKAKAEEAQVWKTRLATQAAITALTAKGVEAPAKLLKLISFENVEIDDDGSVIDGLDDQIEELETDLPQLFPRKKGPKAPGVDASTQGKPGKKSTADQFSEWFDKQF